jgi:hypothetical protein
MISRRNFVAAVAAAAVMPKKVFASSAADFDETAAVFLADIHINGQSGKKMLNFLRSNVAEILRMDPLPRHVFSFGDIAHTVGRKIDYDKAYPELKLLTDAGIKLTLGLGNHDHRKPFFERWPEYEKLSVVSGEALTVTSLPDYDMIMLDSLYETGKIGALNEVHGAISSSAQEWILENLPNWKRPFFIGAHHPETQIRFAGKMGGLKAEMSKFPNCRGFINGHTHVWITNYVDSKNPNTVPWLTLPSSGCWGDIGYATFKVGQWRGRKAAIASLIQKDFFLRNPVPKNKRPPLWDMRMEHNKGAKCIFAI